MTSRQRALVFFGLLAAAAAVFFLGLSIDHDVYAPGAGAVARHLPHGGRLRDLTADLPPIAQHALTPVKILRKSYSIVAFAIVGFFAAPLIPRRRRLIGDVLLVAAFSTLIEIVQKFAGADESFASNLFDIACGAVGGALGSVLWNAVTRRRPRGDALR